MKQTNLRWEGKPAYQRVWLSEYPLRKLHLLLSWLVLLQGFWTRRSLLIRSVFLENQSSETFRGEFWSWGSILWLHLADRTFLYRNMRPTVRWWIFFFSPCGDRVLTGKVSFWKLGIRQWFILISCLLRVRKRRFFLLVDTFITGYGHFIAKGLGFLFRTSIAQCQWFTRGYNMIKNLIVYPYDKSFNYAI